MNCGADISSHRGPAVRCAACQTKFRRQVQNDWLRAKRRKPGTMRETDGILYEVVWNGNQTPEPPANAGERPEARAMPDTSPGDGDQPPLWQP